MIRNQIKHTKSGLEKVTTGSKHKWALKMYREASSFNSREFYNHLNDVIQEQNSIKEVKQNFADKMYRVYLHDQITTLKTKEYTSKCDGLIWQNDQAQINLFDQYTEIVNEVGLTSEILVETFLTLEKIHNIRKGQGGYELDVIL
jgi:hypothetical protein